MISTISFSQGNDLSDADSQEQTICSILDDICLTEEEGQESNSEIIDEICQNERVRCKDGKIKSIDFKNLGLTSIPSDLKHYINITTVNFTENKNLELNANHDWKKLGCQELPGEMTEENNAYDCKNLKMVWLPRTDQIAMESYGYLINSGVKVVLK